MTIEERIYTLVVEAIQASGIDAEVSTARQEVKQEGDQDVVELPSVVIKRDGVTQDYTLAVDDPVHDEAAFTIFSMSEDYLETVELERSIVERVMQDGRLLSATVGEDQTVGFQFYTRQTELVVRV